MKRARAFFLIGLLFACHPAAPEPPMSAGFPLPRIPQDDPLTPEKAVLGRFLFYDRRLSGNQTQACASCHEQARAFTDGRAQAVGSTGQLHPRSAMSIANVVYASALTWANPVVTELAPQALLPMFGEHPVELGLSGREDELLSRLRADARYQSLFASAFPAAADPISISSITKALASFERTLISSRSPYDRYVYEKQEDALSASAQRGMALYFSERLECFHCHGGFLFSDAVVHADSTFDETNFHNNGLYNIGGTGAYPEGNQGLFELTGKDKDRGRFRAPSLRNIAVTAPYMHDGSIATLEEVLEHYARGGRLITSGPHAGDGALHPNKSLFIRGFELSPAEKRDVVAFLNSLTDAEFLHDPRFSDPFQSVPPPPGGTLK